MKTVRSKRKQLHSHRWLEKLNSTSQLSFIKFSLVFYNYILEKSYRIFLVFHLNGRINNFIKICKKNSCSKAGTINIPCNQEDNKYPFKTLYAYTEICDLYSFRTINWAFLSPVENTQTCIKLTSCTPSLTIILLKRLGQIFGHRWS